MIFARRPIRLLCGLVVIVTSTPAHAQGYGGEATQFSQFLPRNGSKAMTGTLDMGNFRILNIGNAGTDFTSAGGLTLAGVLTLPNGTVGAPGLTFAGDTDADTGVFLGGEDDLELTVNGSAKLLITSSLNLNTSTINFVGGQLVWTAGTGFSAAAGSAAARIQQNQDSVTGAELIGSADAASEVATRVGTKYSDAQSGNLADLICAATDADGTPTNKWCIRRDGIPRYTVDARTIANNAVGASPATLTLLPNSGYVELTCNDPDGCTITMSETTPGIGEVAVICNLTANASTFTDTAGVSEMAGNFAAGIEDCITFVYGTNTWRETARSNN